MSSGKRDGYIDYFCQFAQGHANQDHNSSEVQLQVSIRRTRS